MQKSNYLMVPLNEFMGHNDELRARVNGIVNIRFVKSIFENGGFIAGGMPLNVIRACNGCKKSLQRIVARNEKIDYKNKEFLYNAMNPVSIINRAPEEYSVIKYDEGIYCEQQVKDYITSLRNFGFSPIKGALHSSHSFIKSDGDVISYRDYGIKQSENAIRLLQMLNSNQLEEWLLTQAKSTGKRFSNYGRYSYIYNTISSILGLPSYILNDLEAVKTQTLNFDDLSDLEPVELIQYLCLSEKAFYRSPPRVHGEIYQHAFAASKEWDKFNNLIEYINDGHILENNNLCELYGQFVDVSDKRRVHKGLISIFNRLCAKPISFNRSDIDIYFPDEASLDNFSAVLNAQIISKRFSDDKAILDMFSNRDKVYKYSYHQSENEYNIFEYINKLISISTKYDLTNLHEGEFNPKYENSDKIVNIGYRDDVGCTPIEFQFINYKMGSPDKILDGFDLENVSAAIVNKGGELYIMYSDKLESLENNRKIEIKNFKCGFNMSTQWDRLSKYIDKNNYREIVLRDETLEKYFRKHKRIWAIKVIFYLISRRHHVFQHDEEYGNIEPFASIGKKINGTLDILKRSPSATTVSLNQITCRHPSPQNSKLEQSEITFMDTLRALCEISELNSLGDHCKIVRNEYDYEVAKFLHALQKSNVKYSKELESLFHMNYGLYIAEKCSDNLPSTIVDVLNIGEADEGTIKSAANILNSILDIISTTTEAIFRNNWNDDIKISVLNKLDLMAEELYCLCDINSAVDYAPLSIFTTAGYNTYNDIEKSLEGLKLRCIEKIKEDK